MLADKGVRPLRWQYIVKLRKDTSFFVRFDFSSDEMREIQAFLKKMGRIIRPITIKDVLDEQIV
jgi:ribosomal protein S6